MSSATELAAWFNGVPLGGPNSDGRYPLTYADDLIYLVYCPEAQALNPSLIQLPIEVFVNTATSAAATATLESVEAQQASIDAQTYAANALTSQTITQISAAAVSAAEASVTADADQAAIDAASAAANAAIAVAAAASITGVATNPSVLYPLEKRSLQLDYAKLVNDHTGLIAIANSLGVTTEKNNYETAFNTLTSYLATLTVPVPWNDKTDTTTLN